MTNEWETAVCFNENFILSINKSSTKESPTWATIFLACQGMGYWSSPKLTFGNWEDLGILQDPRGQTVVGRGADHYGNGWKQWPTVVRHQLPRHGQLWPGCWGSSELSLLLGWNADGGGIAQQEKSCTLTLPGGGVRGCLGQESLPQGGCETSPLTSPARPLPTIPKLFIQNLSWNFLFPDILLEMPFPVHRKQ